MDIFFQRLPLAETIVSVHFDILAFIRAGLLPEADTGFRQSQASLIWRELEEEEEEGLDEEPRGLFRSVLRRQRNRAEDSRTEAPGRRQHRKRMSDHPDDDCVRYFLLGTLAAVLAVFVNLVYPFLFKAKWS